MVSKSEGQPLGENDTGDLKDWSTIKTPVRHDYVILILSMTFYRYGLALKKEYLIEFSNP